MLCCQPHPCAEQKDHQEQPCHETSRKCDVDEEPVAAEGDEVGGDEVVHGLVYCLEVGSELVQGCWGEIYLDEGALVVVVMVVGCGVLLE